MSRQPTVLLCGAEVSSEPGYYLGLRLKQPLELLAEMTGIRNS